MAVKAKSAKKDDKKASKKPAAKAVKASAKPGKAVKAAKPLAKEKLSKPIKKVIETPAVVEVEAFTATVEVTAPVEDVVVKPKVKKEKAPSAKARAAAAALQAHNAEENKKWNDLKDKFGSEKAPTYSMSSQYEANKPLQHKVLGWGFIISNNNDRLEVLFESGTRMLISNYNPGKK